MAETDSFLHLARPLGPVTVGSAPTTAPLNVVIQPQAIFSILDHSLRRNADQDRVIGTLLGTRSEDGTEVEIRSCFAVGHTETTDQVEVDMEYQKQMLALHLKANPKEVLVGWYATSSELNTFSALIQNFYGQSDGTWPHPAVHLTVSTEPGKDIETRAYISAPVGVTVERAADSAAFIPVPHEIRYGEAEKNGLEAIANARDTEDRQTNIFTDIEALERAVEEVIVTTTSKMSWSFPTWPTQSAHKWNFPTDLLPLNSLSEEARAPLPARVPNATSEAARVVEEAVNSATKRGILRKPALKKSKKKKSLRRKRSTCHAMHLSRSCLTIAFLS
uniref:Eukaryotic translation initiation factor 3 subunit F n=1 Tax=Talaromyces marneffei PM1 TaxID=1077442 RepID=A0A093VEG9_TALMA